MQIRLPLNLYPLLKIVPVQNIRLPLNSIVQKQVHSIQPPTALTKLKAEIIVDSDTIFLTSCN